MEKHLLFEKLAYLMKYAGSLWGGQLKVDIHDQNVIRDCYSQILPGQRLNMGCPECVKYAIVYCVSYYEREWPKWQAQNQPAPQAEIEPEVEVQPEVEPEVEQPKETKKSRKKAD